ncbi:MAG: cupin-like domain-containing protein [Paracoccaceae bacterium]|nr:cupin-like domain-containing protein [Paracoccaceae bacterium]
MSTRLGTSRLWVEYSCDGMYHPRPNVNNGRYFRKRMAASDALERIVFCDHYPDVHYISAIDAESLDGVLSADLPCLNGPGGPPDNRVLFVGNRRSGTHMHYDLPDNVVLVLEGSKRFILFPPEQTDDLAPYATHHYCSNFSSLTDRDLVSRATACADSITLTVQRGEMIYIPSCWWHRVTNDGFSVSLTNLWPVSKRRREMPSYRRYADALARHGTGDL